MDPPCSPFFLDVASKEPHCLQHEPRHLNRIIRSVANAALPSKAVRSDLDALAYVDESRACLFESRSEKARTEEEGESIGHINLTLAWEETNARCGRVLDRVRSRSFGRRRCGVAQNSEEIPARFVKRVVVVASENLWKKSSATHVQKDTNARLSVRESPHTSQMMQRKN